MEKKGKVKLSVKMELDNIISGLSFPLDWLSSIHFTINCYRASAKQFKRMHGETSSDWFKRSAKQFRFVWPHQITCWTSLQGVSGAAVKFMVQAQSTPTSPSRGPTWAIVDNHIGMRFSFLVPGAQAWKADVLLRQMESSWHVESKSLVNAQGYDSRQYAYAHPAPFDWHGGMAPSWSFGNDIFTMVGKVLGLHAMLVTSAIDQRKFVRKQVKERKSNLARRASGLL